MQLAILFWFYKEPEICLNRLQILKRYNPDLLIYGLYGGKKEEAQRFKNKLGKYLDDFYTSPFDDPNWKWINGDLVLLDWYKKRGKQLRWDSVVVVQWDMLVLDSFKNQFPNLKENQLFLSGYKELDLFTEIRWYWTTPFGKNRKTFNNFVKHVKKVYGYNQKPTVCLFVLQILPRIFLEKYSEVKNKELGMLEYKVPTYAKIFNTPVYYKDIGVHWWGDVKSKPINAEPKEIKLEFVKRELGRKHGWRMFHPYFGMWKEF